MPEGHWLGNGNINDDPLFNDPGDWDFSLQGRIRQSNRMKSFADFEKKNGRWVICDFIAPTEETRKAFDADYTIWLDTIKQGRVVSSKLSELKKINNLPFDVQLLAKSKKFEDTSKMFEQPKKVDERITSFLDEKQIKLLSEKIKNV